MSLQLAVTSPNSQLETKWARELQEALRFLPEAHEMAVQALRGTAAAQCQLVFIDGTGDAGFVTDTLASLDRRGKAVFLIVADGAALPQTLRDGQVDDVLVHPFRPVEVMGKIQHYRQLLMWDEVKSLNSSFSELLQELHEDLRLTERLQKSKLPLRFPEVKGFRVTSRYLAGMRAGGDHFDLADTPDGSQLSMVLSDSSSYGLSSAVLSALMRVAVKLSSDEARSSAQIVKRIHTELTATLGEKDRLSLFYGVVSRKDYRLRYLNLGTSSAFLSSAGKPYQELSLQGGPIVRGKELPECVEGEIHLQPEDRLALVSDGFVEASGGPAAACALLNEYRQKEAVETVNELVYRVKAKFTDPDDMPEQDCTAIIFDVDARLLRLAAR